MVKVATLSWLILWSVFQLNAADNQTSIAVKASPKRNVQPIAIGVETFKELIEQSDIFVDKSLLIKYILQRYVRTLVLAYPSGWGKSVNLNMLKTFLEIEVDDEGNTIEPRSSTRNYRLFQYGEFVTSPGHEDNLQTPLLISNEEDLLLEYQGEYPVIYADFKNMVTSITGFNFVRGFRREVSRIFSRHDYMIKVFKKILRDSKVENKRKIEANEKLEKFQHFIKQVVTPEDTMNSLAFLSQILWEHFNKKVFLLIDNYDVPLNDTFFGVLDIPEEVMKEHVNFYQKFLNSSVTNEYVRNSVLTGTLPLTKELVLPNVYYVENSNTMVNEFHRFYGFDKNEIDTLCYRLQINDNLREGFVARFHGYKVGVNSKTQVCEPMSMVKWLGKKKIDTVMDELARKKLYIDPLRNAMHTIVSGLELPVDITEITLNRVDIDHLRSTSKNENSFGPLTSSALKYLYAVGYLTLSEILFEGKNCLRFPNDEIYAMMRHALIQYYEKKFSILTVTFMPMANFFTEKFIDFVNSTAHTPDKLSFWFGNAINSLYEHRDVNATISEKENVVYSVLSYMLTFVDSYKRYPNFNPEIILLGEKHGVIITATYNRGSAEYAVKKSESYVQLLKLFKLEKIKLVGIDVGSEMSTDIRGFDYYPR